MNRILITGGCGFVGATLALRLRHDFPSASICALDSLYRRGSELNVARLEAAGVQVVRGDVRERQAILAVGPCDLIIDAAAEPSVLAGRDDSAAYVVDTNLGGTLNVLEAARIWKAALVFLSTSRVYPVDALRAIRRVETKTRFTIASGQSLPGISGTGIAEAFPLDDAGRTLYGATKYASEIMAREYAVQFDLPILINRCGVIAGPWQMGRTDQGVIGLWVARHLYGRPLTIFGYGGKQVRDALHVDDLADLIIAQMQCRDRWDGSVYNVGGGVNISFSLLELTETVRSCTGCSVPVDFDDAVRPGDVPLYITDAARVRSAFGWQPQRDMTAIVTDTAAWINQHREALKPILEEKAEKLKS